MKRVTFYAGMGFAGAKHLNDITYAEDEFASLTEADLYQIADEYAQEYVESWYEVSEV